jgi:hypothetical protein
MVPPFVAMPQPETSSPFPPRQSRLVKPAPYVLHSQVNGVTADSLVVSSRPRSQPTICSVIVLPLHCLSAAARVLSRVFAP